MRKLSSLTIFASTPIKRLVADMSWFLYLLFSHECVVSVSAKDRSTAYISPMLVFDNCVCLWICAKALRVSLCMYFLANYILLQIFFCHEAVTQTRIRILCANSRRSLKPACSVTKAALFFPPVVKSNIPSDSISSALQVLILYSACVHAFPCHPLLFSHLSLCQSVCQRARSDEISLSPWQQAARGLRPVLADAWSMIMSIDRKINVALILSLMFRE